MLAFFQVPQLLQVAGTWSPSNQTAAKRLPDIKAARKVEYIDLHESGPVTNSDPATDHSASALQKNTGWSMVSSCNRIYYLRDN